MSKSKWPLTIWLILLTIGIIGGGFYYLGKFFSFERKFYRKTQELEEQMKRLEDDIEEIRKEIPIRVEEGSETDIFCWKTYRNQKHGYEIKYPKEGSLTVYREGDYVKIALPTSFRERYVGIEVIPEPCKECSEFEAEIYINNIKFCLGGTGAEGEGAAGSMYYTTDYFTTKDSSCIKLRSLISASTFTKYEAVREEEEILSLIISTFRFVR